MIKKIVKWISIFYFQLTLDLFTILRFYTIIPMYVKDVFSFFLILRINNSNKKKKKKRTEVLSK